jgi:hypothetical protein
LNFEKPVAIVEDLQFGQGRIHERQDAKYSRFFEVLVKRKSEVIVGVDEPWC